MITFSKTHAFDMRAFRAWVVDEVTFVRASRKLGVAHQTVWAWFYDKRTPSVESLAGIYSRKPWLPFFKEHK